MEDYFILFPKFLCDEISDRIYSYEEARKIADDYNKEYKPFFLFRAIPFAVSHYLYLEARKSKFYI